MGTKRSIFEELIEQGHEPVWIDKSKISEILQAISQYHPDQVWLAHSNLCLSKEIKNQISIPVIGFGFSDPYYFSIERFKGYDIYVTNHIVTFEKHHKKIPMIYNPTACDFRFHNRNVLIEKTKDVSILGAGHHQRFRDTQQRIKIVNNLRAYLGTQFSVYAIGRNWPKHPFNHHAVKGSDFLNVIQTTKLGLDIQDEDSPIAHRIFEYSGCGIPVITKRRPEVLKLFEEDVEILTYSTEEELQKKVSYYLNNVDELYTMGLRAWIRCQDEHNISYRLKHILRSINVFT